MNHSVDRSADRSILDNEFRHGRALFVPPTWHGRETREKRGHSGRCLLVPGGGNVVALLCITASHSSFAR